MKECNMILSHKRFKRDPGEGVTVYTKDLPKGKYKDGDFITLFYATGHISTGKVSRDGTTLYFSLRNFPFTGLNLPNCSDPRDFNVVAISKNRGVKNV